jgi:hypothetical protein
MQHAEKKEVCRLRSRWSLAAHSGLDAEFRLFVCVVYLALIAAEYEFNRINYIEEGAELWPKSVLIAIGVASLRSLIKFIQAVARLC